MQKLPIGIQGFEKLVSNHFLYVDKTDYVYKLVKNNVPYFLSRPRRFGKSLLLSTLRAYWEGKKHLFKGLAIDKLEDSWTPYPVFYIDFNGHSYKDISLEAVLDEHLRSWEALYGTQYQSFSLGERFYKLLVQAYAKEQRGCVILVDEYDKPLLDVIDNSDLQSHNKDIFKGFFSTLKRADEFIQFVFITGITKFSKVSIFSDLNQLRDISLNEEFAGICGISDAELTNYFSEEIAVLSAQQSLSYEECLEALRRTYDGYHFHPNSYGVYNPFSLLNAFSNLEFGSYWFESGTPTFLVKQVKSTGFDVRKITDQTLYASEAMLSGSNFEQPDLLSMLYQTGYLTISNFDSRKRRYTLSFPNEEVKYGFLECLMPAFTPVVSSGTGKDIFTLDDCIETGNVSGIRDIFIALFASIPYSSDDAPFEHYFQTVIYLVFTLLGKMAHCELHTWQGRIDCVVEASRFVYIFELKRDSSAKEALHQIDELGYALPYAADHRKLFKIGINFDSKTRMIDEWELEE